ncbi:MAG: HAD-IA family hydrolase [Microgenomates group bacterium]
MSTFFFDLDGPILDVSEKYYQTYCYSINELSYSPLTKMQYWELKKHKVPDDIILSLSGVKIEQVELYKQRRNEVIETKEFLKYDYVWKEMFEILPKLKKDNTLNILTSRTYSEIAKQQITELGLNMFFEEVIVAECLSDKRWKDKGKILQEFNKKSNAEKVFMIGDTETDILAGKSAGVITIGVDYGIRDKDWLELVSPDFLVGSISNLFEILKI